MPTVTVQGKTFACDNGANLRKVLLKHDINLHNGQSKIINCRGSWQLRNLRRQNHRRGIPSQLERPYQTLIAAPFSKSRSPSRLSN